MNRQEVKKLLYNKYILPTEMKQDLYIGIEIEMPAVNLSGEATDFSVTQNVFSSFIERYNFSADKFDDNGICYSATEHQTEDKISFDCSYNNLELSLGRSGHIQELEQRFYEYASYLNEQLLKKNHILTGMGINPNHNTNRKDCIPSPRYRMLQHYLMRSKEWGIPKYFHQHPDFGTFSSASQVQLDIKKENLIPALKSFSLVEPVKAVLFNNSVLSSEPNLLCVRDDLWENSTHGINPHNVGMYDCDLESIDDLLEYICSTSIFCTERDGKYICFKPIPITEYLKSGKIKGQYYENGSYIQTEFTPEPQDINYLRTYKFEDLTFRGTIEFRSVCSQPFRDAMTVAAFHTGLMNAPKKLANLLEHDHTLYHHGYSATELRKIMNLVEWPAFINRHQLKLLCFKVLDLSYNGLKQRGCGEEKYLDALYIRAESLCSPGRYMLNEVKKGIPMRRIIQQYAAF